MTLVWEWVSPAGDRHIVQPNLDPTIWPAMSATDVETGETYYVAAARMHRIQPPERLFIDCRNCGQRRMKDRNGWPNCNPFEPHRAIMATGCEGRCLLCGTPGGSYVHRGVL